MPNDTYTIELQFLRELHFIEARPNAAEASWITLVAVPLGTALH